MAKVLLNAKKKIRKPATVNIPRVKIVGGKYRPQIRSRHPSHSCLRGRFKNLPKLPFRSLIRLGSTTKTLLNNIVEINSIEAIQNSSNKLLMKQCFDKLNVKTAIWFRYDRSKGGFYRLDSRNNIINCNAEELPYPIIAKRHYGSRGQGNTKLDTPKELDKFLKTNSPANYIFERFHNYAREYRLHVTEEGCFYTCRKMMKLDTPEEDKWFRNDANCTWFVESNPKFDKPINWDEIVEDCVKALKSVGLDFGAIDLRVQSAKGTENPDYIVVEINSAPSFGEVTREKYFEMLPHLIQKKYNKTRN